MKRNLFSIICILIATLVLFAGCTSVTGKGNTVTPEQTAMEDNNVVETKTADVEKEVFTLVSSTDDSYTYQNADGSVAATLTVVCTEGTNHYTVEGNTLYISELTEDTVFELSGVFYGNIVAELDDDVKLELALKGLTLYSYDACPIAIDGGDKVTISAKKETENLIFDLREAVGEEEISAAIYATSDLDLQGKGELYVTSEHNNGVHTKDDLKVKNLTLQVECEDNALKGNDSVTIESGTITLIARSGDGIKTSNSSLSSKGNQKGTVSLSGGDILIYAASDGIDAAYNVEIEESDSLNLQIFTGQYSKYTETASASTTSVPLINTATGAGSGTGFGPGTQPSKPNGNGGFSGNGGFGGNGGLGGNGGQPGGFGMNEGNSNKSETSQKGIKADNEVIISGGNITIQSYDDAIHANNDEELENGETPVGNVSISGGSILISTNDDGVHADGTLTISGGTLSIEKCYEGLEGNTIVITDGVVSVISSDDGLNATTTSGIGITISGGTLYIYAGGDGFDSNSTTQYGAILFEGGRTVVISTGNADSSIDSERGYQYTGGKVIAIGKSGGMGSEALKGQNFSSVGTSKTISLQSGSYLVVSGIATVRIPTSLNALVIVLGDNAAEISSSATTSATLDGNGVAWKE